MEERIARLERIVELIEADVRELREDVRNMPWNLIRVVGISLLFAWILHLILQSQSVH